MRYFLSLGSNINAQKNIEFAVSELSEIFSDLNSSSIHKTKAEGFEGEDFLNSVISGTCQFSFDALNKKLKEIENAAGRDRNAPKFSARTLDIDIVLQLDEDDEIIYESEEITQYKFVSEPLQEIL
ncbi:MAG: 2-amino-4-hydroxy-6-hydroxymethyldihydropteridine diphosphokinase [SAR86 cluster bacterium]|jgi:2-amino-4-hydroxy-6-hydroxymethyldihydropteridine diphosphokinase|nr:2-amino-4-hydroxy-6-hydroxymethyldihydropteridine diphosphokinase [SAR86 cluster bacterium]MDO7600812.1 2-amino-4-hydroxy-6-hydroxymethyldihydropteridine diphosphokinase [SAR86 cluster bacterium]MDO7693971.1 2-amino-4-hydroxy-6-hydroxymethyldihydropteridine diphosphokinase [Gammaproteobacteria bacterium]|tara:strand:+ start:57 stop:434 length:378 start_codon:yes stop_codon:yes gene_type:complete